MKVAVVGALGRMGQQVCAAVEAADGLELGAALDAGDDLVNEFGRYKLGRRTYQGGSFIGGLVQAVIRFINRWTTTKEKVVELDKKRQSFIEKSQQLPPLSLGGNGDQEPVTIDTQQLDLQGMEDEGAAAEGGQRGANR